MKKILILLIAMLAMVPTVSNAQSKALNKALKKEYKAKMKELNKEGWKLFGSTRTLEVALLSHYDKLNNLGENGTEIMGYATVSSTSHKNLLKQTAIANACNTYARNCGSHVKGLKELIESELTGVDIEVCEGLTGYSIRERGGSVLAERSTEFIDVLGAAVPTINF